ncbi:MAG: hypothetical protein ACRYHQ_10080 [Janthinobacterium lividum]
MLEIQLACLNPPNPGPRLRSMMRRGLVVETAFGADGIPVFRPTHNLRAFGKRVLFLGGWAMEGDRVRPPFRRGPGTMPPLFLSVILEAKPLDVRNTTHFVRGGDGVAMGSFSPIKATNGPYSKQGSTVTCYGN